MDRLPRQGGGARQSDRERLVIERETAPFVDEAFHVVDRRAFEPAEPLGLDLDGQDQLFQYLVGRLEAAAEVGE